MFEDSHEKLSQLYLLTLRVVNGVECTTRRMVYHLNIPEHQPVMMSSVFFSVLRDIVEKDFTHKEV